jgi:hypothetical protein
VFINDTTYSPDGDHVNPRATQNYDTANEAINQPTLEFYALIALRLSL